MNQPSDYHQPRITILGAALRKARKDAGCGVRELARRIGAEPGLLSNWEFGQRPPSLVDVAAILGALGVIGGEKSQILHLASLTEASVVILGNHNNRNHASVRYACEAAASSITLWHSLLVPDLLQLPEYRQAVLVAQGHSVQDARHLIAVRKERDAIVVGREAKPVTAYISEDALTDQMASSASMARQLRFLAELNAAITAKAIVRVVPSRSSRQSGLLGPFTLYGMSYGLIAYLSHHASGSFLPDHDGHYRQLVNQLDQLALPKEESSMAFTQLAAKFGQDGE